MNQDPNLTSAPGASRSGGASTARQVGPWRLLGVLGEGGMGVVYLAERSDGAFDRQVALKLLRPGLDAGSFEARFLQERRTLAALEHPNIAQLLDAGRSSDGLPYFAMERVEGEPIDAWCQRRALGVNERIGLFLQVCEAVQYAHGRLIVHRDIKPSNVLVDTEGRVRLLDFGIAKLLDETGDTGLTRASERLLTPQYAAPEQLLGEPVGVAADVYALGMLLYLLMADELPYRLAGATAAEQQHLVCERNPQPPSSLATDPSTASQLRGDLDQIVLMALRKEPIRRYASVDQLSADLKRWQEGLPISARPDTIGYRARRFVKRNRLGVAAASLIFLSLAGGLVASLWQAREAQAARDLAEQRYRDVRSLANSLLTEIDAALITLPGATPARRQLVERALAYLDQLSTDAERDPELLSELATGFERIADILGSPYEANLGESEQALRHAEHALELRLMLAQRSGHDASNSLALASSELQVAGLREQMDPSGEAIFGLVPNALVRLENHLGDAPADGDLALLAARAMNLLGDAHFNRNEFDQAIALQERALAISEHALEDSRVGKDAWRRARGVTKVKLGMARWWDEAPPVQVLALLKAGVADLEALLVEQPNNARALRVVGASNSMLSNVIMYEDSNVAAKPYLERAIQIGEHLLSLDPHNRQSRMDLANWRLEVALFYETGLAWAEADEEAERALALLDALTEEDPSNRALGARRMQASCIRGRMLLAGRAAGFDAGNYAAATSCQLVRDCVGRIDEFVEHMPPAWTDTDVVESLRAYESSCDAGR